MIRKILHFGVTELNNPNADRGILFSNFISLLGAVITFTLFILQGSLIAWDSIAFSSLVMCVFFFVPYLLNHFWRGLSGRVFLSFYIPTAIIAASIFGKLTNNNPEANFETQFYDYRFFLMATGMLAVVLYDRSNRIWRNILLGYVMLCLALFDPLHNMFGVGYFQTDHRDPTYYFTNIVVFLAFLAQAIGMLFLRQKIDSDEEELKKLSLIAEQTNNAVFITDRDFKILWVNHAFEKISEFQLSEIKGKTIFEFLHHEVTSQVTIDYIRTKVTKKEAFVCEINNRNKSGESYWSRMNCQPYNNNQGTFEGFFAIEQDVTETKKFLVELEKAKEEAENSDRLKTIFLGSLSHEVRTPLQGILGFVELLESENLKNQDRQEYRSIIKKRAIDMQNIIEALLDIASLESGEIKASPKPFDLGQEISSIYEKFVSDFELLNKPLNFRLENHIDGKNPVKVDQQHLEQVTKNLLHNAIKYSNEGTIILMCEKNDNFYFIKVIDQGIGIEPNKLESIFEPFRQAHEGLSRSKGGIGLGLSICKKMVELWRGQIDVTSEPGKGSIFSFSIPTFVGESDR